MRSDPPFDSTGGSSALLVGLAGTGKMADPELRAAIFEPPSPPRRPSSGELFAARRERDPFTAGYPQTSYVWFGAMGGGGFGGGCFGDGGGGGCGDGGGGGC